MKKLKVHLHDNLPGMMVNLSPGDEKKLMKPITKRAKEAALKTKFNEKKSAPKNQQGKIIYYFSLN